MKLTLNTSILFFLVSSTGFLSAMQGENAIAAASAPKAVLATAGSLTEQKHWYPIFSPIIRKLAEEKNLARLEATMEMLSQKIKYFTEPTCIAFSELIENLLVKHEGLQHHPVAEKIKAFKQQLVEKCNQVVVEPVSAAENEQKVSIAHNAFKEAYMQYQEALKISNPVRWKACDAANNSKYSFEKKYERIPAYNEFFAALEIEKKALLALEEAYWNWVKVAEFGKSGKYYKEDHWLMHSYSLLVSRKSGISGGWSQESDMMKAAKSFLFMIDTELHECKILKRTKHFLDNPSKIEALAIWKTLLQNRALVLTAWERYSQVHFEELFYNCDIKDTIDWASGFGDIIQKAYRNIQTEESREKRNAAKAERKTQKENEEKVRIESANEQGQRA